jgi:hypothetical protein
MAKSKFAIKLDAIQKDVYDYLKPVGFRQRGRTFNRRFDNGLVHVINFQMGRYPVNFVEIPRYKPDVYGMFTVNLGVFIPEIDAVVMNRERPGFILEYDCEIKDRLGPLIPPGRDVWWDLIADEETLSAEILTLLKQYGLPYLDRFSSREAIIREWQEYRMDIGFPPRAALSIAVILAAQGKQSQAEEVLKQCDLSYAPYAQFVRDVCRRMELSYPG